MTPLDELIARLEAETEGSKALNADIHEYLTGSRLVPAYFWVAEKYTQSIDDAMTLADPKWWAHAEDARHPETKERTCRAWFDLGEWPYMQGTYAATIPLAICAAAFRAKQMIASRTERQAVQS